MIRLLYTVLAWLQSFLDRRDRSEFRAHDASGDAPEDRMDS